MKKAIFLRYILSPGTLYLNIVNTTALSAFWMGEDMQVRCVPVWVHTGRFQDSVIITDCFESTSEIRQVDFRYFPMWKRLEPYRIFPGQNTLLVANEGCVDVAFGRRGEKILCQAGTTTRIPVRPIPGWLADKKADGGTSL